ncbi:Predicted naringenin-chalcone synthase [Cyclobacterium lianum]|uniref:Predicted naringenin-chalcone synthase n=1 Tax=Cyclobacterium lianum TaxID=388280 RepID=A0A1M7I5Y0_9BACT|nr:type III polyketide synthase [Cyclobacterium lianum]SHM36174.1 Predicted naringenin-chalcone synthase [Cyclobacterium lianum]
MQSHIVSIGLANPGNPIPQEKISRFMQMAHGLDRKESRKLGFVYRKSGIRQRYSALSDFHHEDPAKFAFFPNNPSLEPFPGTSSRMRIFRKEAPVLANLAIERCLKKADALPGSITHLVLVSCTGMYAPGVEMDIIQTMGFANTIERYAIHFMGCYAAFNAIKLADRICHSEQDAKVLVVGVELCTIHFQKDYNEDNVIANALFGDGAAAVLIKSSAKGLAIKAYQSNILVEGESDMAWSIGDFGFEMKLSKYIPELLSNGIQQFGRNLEKKFGISRIRQFAIHPGGRQILKRIEMAFGIREQQNFHAHEVLGKFGNMSSVTILFVLAGILEDPAIQGDILAMGFGPGLTLETLLLEK